MQITWHGLSCFEISAKPGPTEVTVITDPFFDEAGIKVPRSMKASMVVVSHDSPLANNISAVAGHAEALRPFSVMHAGEYEVQGIFATGIRVPKKDGTEHTIYRIFAEGIKVAFLGALDRALTEEEQKTLGDIDILLVPVGGETVLSTDTAQDVVNVVEPRLVIPYYFMVPGCTLKLDSVETFCKEFSCSREDLPKLKISKAGLPEEEMKMVVLSKE